MLSAVGLYLSFREKVSLFCHHRLKPYGYKKRLKPTEGVMFTPLAPLASFQNFASRFALAISDKNIREISKIYLRFFSISLLRLPILLSLLILTIAACGGDDGVDLSQDFTGNRSTVGQTTGKYPKGWVAGTSNDNNVLLASDGGVMANFQTMGPHPLEKGQHIIIVVGIPASRAAEAVGSESVTLQAFIQTYTEYITGENPNWLVSLGSIESFESDDQFGQVNSGTIINTNGSVGAVFMASFVDGGYAVLFGMAASDDMETLLDVMKAVAGTVVVRGHQ